MDRLIRYELNNDIMAFVLVLISLILYYTSKDTLYSTVVTAGIGYFFRASVSTLAQKEREKVNPNE